MRLETVTKTDNRSQSVQVLRAIAFLLIFLSHAFGRLGWWGAFGVSLFIVLSGYLEAKHHLNDKLDAKIFAKKKVKKVYPLHSPLAHCPPSALRQTFVQPLDGL